MSKIHPISIVQGLLLFLAMAVAGPATAQTILFADDFSSGGLSAWALPDSVDCAAANRTWSVVDSVLVGTEGSLSECAVLTHSSNSWNGYRVRFRARLIAGHSFGISLGYLSPTEKGLQIIFNRAGAQYDVRFLGPNDEHLGGIYNSVDSPQLDEWTDYTIDFYGDVARVAWSGPSAAGSVISQPAPPVGNGLSFLPPATPADDDGIVEIDDVVVETGNAPECELSIWNFHAATNSYQLRAEVYNANSAVILPEDVAVPNGITITDWLQGYTDVPFQLIGENDAGADTATVAVTNGLAPSFAYYSADREEIVETQGTWLRWRTIAGGDSIVIQPEDLRFPVQEPDLPSMTFSVGEDSLYVEPGYRTSYRAYLYENGQVSDFLFVIVDVEPFAIDRFATSRAEILPGESTLLAWRLNASGNVRLEPGGEVQSGIQGTFNVLPDSDTTYSLIANFASFEVSAQLPITIAPPRIYSFSSSPRGIQPGESALLSWHCNYGDELRIEPGGLIATDMKSGVVVSPDTTTTYTLTLVYGEVEVQRDFLLQVVDISVFSANMDSRARPWGTPVTASWHFDPPNLEVSVDGVSGFSTQDSYTFYPMDAGELVVEAKLFGAVETLRFPYHGYDPAPDAENLYLGTAPGSFGAEIPDLGGEQLFEVHLMAARTANRVSGLTAEVLVPPCMFVLGMEFPQAVQNFASPPRIDAYWSGSNPCEPDGDLVDLAKITIYAADNSSGNCATERHVIRIGPNPDTPARPGLRACLTEDWYPVGYFGELVVNGVHDVATGVEPLVQGGTRILSVSPNPARESSVLRVQMAEAGPAVVRILDLAGRVVREEELLVDAPGAVDLRWNGRDARGRTVASGIYLVQVRQGGDLDTRRVVRLR